MNVELKEKNGVIRLLISLLLLQNHPINSNAHSFWDNSRKHWFSSSSRRYYNHATYCCSNRNRYQSSRNFKLSIVIANNVVTIAIIVLPNVSIIVLDLILFVKKNSYYICLNRKLNIRNMFMQSPIFEKTQFEMI